MRGRVELCYGRLVARWPLVIPVLICLPACSGEPAERAASRQPLEIEDVAPSVDATLSTEGDVKGKPVISGVAGVLPSDYPRQLPTHQPATIIDFGAVGNGWSYVEFDSPTPSGVVVTGLERRMADGGWRVERSGQAELGAVHEGVDVRVMVTPLTPGSRIRVEYR